jgi:hypothetical protein
VDKCAVIVTSDVYVPYDIQKSFFRAELSYEKLFPKLDTQTLLKHKTDLELISAAYDGVYTSADDVSQTRLFVREKAYEFENIERFAACKTAELRLLCEKARTYLDWIEIAKQTARLNYYGAKVNKCFDTVFVDEGFERFILSNYALLSGEVNLDFPPILPKTLKLITGKTAARGNGKTALIVMDGMSLFDFEVFSRYMQDFKYEYNASFALIPTTTSISRQSLLTGKYPSQLANPFSLNGEENGFFEAGINLGYARNEIGYFRGYEPQIDLTVKLACVIINDVDDMVHNQLYGRAGMLISMEALAERGKLQKLIRSLYAQGFEVFITSDHGNTPCVGVGGFRFGVEAQTKSKRMAVLKNFAEETDALRNNTILFPGIYLDKAYRYYLCKRGVSFDNNGEETTTHGGMCIDEVIVPFIKILAV